MLYIKIQFVCKQTIRLVVSYIVFYLEDNI